MIPLQVNWADVWAMTGIGIGIVFVILILLVYILQIFSKVANQSKTEVPVQAPQTKAEKSEEDLDKIAIATALYLYSEESHDIESGILTIQHHDGNAWNPID